MQANSYPLSTIFGQDVRYVVPLYQRPYVWGQETHWEPLWEDVRALVHRLIIHEVGDEEHPGAAPHFLGAIVLEQQLVDTGSITTRLVIDGQQRLTTLQLLLAAAAKVAEDRREGRSARLLRRLVENDPDLVVEPSQAMKVWPTNANREAFAAVMSPGGPPPDRASDPNNLIDEAFAFFERTVEEWAEDLGDQESEHFDALTRAVRELIKIVVIDLEEGDNAQVIFETLNARGTPLLAIDLVKNLVFQVASREGLDLDRLYREEWSAFDSEFWRKDVRQGRLRRPRIELFLMHWLAMQRGDEVSATALYPTFRVVLDARTGEPVGELVTNFSRYAELFASFDTREDSAEKRFFGHLAALDTTTVLPLVLYVMGLPEQTLPAEHRRRVLDIMDSYLVRRLVCQLTTKRYNVTAMELLRDVKGAPERADEVIEERLTRLEGQASRWPTDEEVREALLERPVYKSIAQARVVMVLSEVERALRTELSEPVDLPGRLSLEHVLPQSWQEHWPLRSSEPSLIQDRERHIHRIGNLTLVTSRLNPSLSNSGWAKKRGALNEHSVLLMNRKLVDGHSDSWGEEEIDRRSGEIAELVCRIWPRPDGAPAPAPGAETAGPGATTEVAEISPDPPAEVGAGDVPGRPASELPERTEPLGPASETLAPESSSRSSGDEPQIDGDRAERIVRQFHEDERSRGAIAAEHGMAAEEVERLLWAWEPVVYPHIRLAADPSDIAAARDGELEPARLVRGEAPALRWDRVAARSGLSVGDVKALYDRARGEGAASHSFTGRGRRFDAMDA